MIFRKKIETFLVRGLEAIILPDRVRKYKTQNSAFVLHRMRLRRRSRASVQAPEFGFTGAQSRGIL
jgi:hypothetical protein